MTVAIDTAAGQGVANQTINLTPSSPGCAASGGATQCSAAIPLAPGGYEMSVSTFSGLSGGGNVLSENQREAFTVQAGQANRLALALYGVPASIAVAPSGSGLQGSQGSGFTAPPGSMAPQSFTVSAADASGNIIVGQGAPSFVLTSSSIALSVSTANPANPNVFTLTPPASLATIAATISVTANPGDNSACAEPGATCSTTFKMTYAPFANDDWITFAHDFARTGRETQTTGITSTTVSQLQQRWKITLPEGEPVYGSPVVYDGNIVLDGWWGNVYDLSAQDGHIIWETPIGGYPNMVTPTIDTNDGLVFVGNRVTNRTNNYPEPSQLYALRLATGIPVWQATMAGTIRAAPVFANGMVFEGDAGGDNPYCINGGVNAYNALTGTLVWSWFVNGATNPGGGGAVWGAIAYDGRQLVFGTGNTCIGDIGTAQGAVSLNPATGAQNWSFVANAASTEDDDTGGGVMVQNGVATFINKNGSLYNVSAGTGAQLTATPLGAPDSLGSFASPGSDGSVYLIGAGLFPQTDSRVRASDLCWVVPPPAERGFHRRPAQLVTGYTSKLDAVNANGEILWSIPMRARIVGYVAVDGEVAFADMDTNVDAIDIASGTVLWTLPSSSGAIFDASPVIVPSGLYAADESGNVYAYGIVQSNTP